MPSLLHNLFTSGQFIPHGHCYLWKTGLVWLHILSDGLIALAYYSIPLLLVYIVRKRGDLPFDWVFLLFGSFIIACGTSHVLEIWTLWHPMYWLSGLVKAVAAVISVATGIVLMSLIPNILALPSPAQIEEANRRLKSEIQERQQIEAQLRSQEYWLNTLIDAVPNVVNMKDGEGRWLISNQEGLKLFQLEGVDYQGKTDAELEEYTEFYQEALFDCQESDERAWRAETISHYEEEILLPDGSAKKFDVAKVPLFNPDGSRKGIVVVASDITQRKQVEAALRESEAKNRAFIQALPDMLFRICSDGTFMDFQAPREDALAMPPSHFLGKSVWEVLPTELAEATMYNVSKAIASGETQLYEYQMTSLDGNQHDYEARYARSLESEALVIVRDISERQAALRERKQAEIALQKSEAQLREQTLHLEKTLCELKQTQSQLIQSEKMSSLGQLVAGVAHEINNPINFIYANLIHTDEYTKELLHLIRLYQQHNCEPVPEIAAVVENLDLDFLQEDLPKMLSSMKAGTNRIREIVLSLRNFSRLDEAEVKAVNLHEGIDSTLLILQNRLKGKLGRPAIEIIKEYGKLPPIECYARQLNQVFINTITNAIDALEEAEAQKRRSAEENLVHSPQQLCSPASLPWIRIRTEVQDDRQVVVRISDNGLGITEEVRQKLFDPFFTTKPVGSGTGLGLSISYQIVVEKHGGSLKCVSAPGQGAEFAIAIPVQQQYRQTSVVRDGNSAAVSG
ncbi:ATP-binding protein [Coleofasciculus sp. FACHB-SPT9]|uniref:PAS domain-containing sensor histidine kinase n=1 Tax=Cyanophyceae TaxID=3028117 RepID=UPI00168566B8|nr:ATP-binding protein [Coleofasciculus sp. FACHB-SPT9]MBD1891270.1 PAS domain-containing protein [Coleofasciculus sp. FACHB-SPT9]